MAGSVNKVILIGNLGKDPEVRFLEGGTAVASFPLATSETYKDKNTNEKRTVTEWHNIVLWRGLAEVAQKYLHKGDNVYIEGKLRTRSWEDKEKNKRYTTEIIADNMTMLSTKAASEERAQNKPASSNESPFNAPENQPTVDDDLPF